MKNEVCTPAEKQILEEYEQTRNVSAIVRKLPYTRYYIQKVLKKHKRCTVQKYTEDQQRYFASVYDQESYYGDSLRSVSQSLKISKWTIEKSIKKYGIREKSTRIQYHIIMKCIRDGMTQVAMSRQLRCTPSAISKKISNNPELLELWREFNP